MKKNIFHNIGNVIENVIGGNDGPKFKTKIMKTITVSKAELVDILGLGNKRIKKITYNNDTLEITLEEE